MLLLIGPLSNVTRFFIASSTSKCTILFSLDRMGIHHGFYSVLCHSFFYTLFTAHLTLSWTQSLERYLARFIYWVVFDLITESGPNAGM